MANIQENRILFFLGAGASIPSGLNGVIGLVHDFRKYLMDNSLSKHLELTNTIIMILDQWKKDTNYPNEIDIELLLETIERLENIYGDNIPYFFRNNESKLKDVSGYDLINGKKLLSEEVKKICQRKLL